MVVMDLVPPMPSFQGSPVSIITSSASGSMSASSASANRSSAAARSCSDSRGHGPVSKAVRAAWTAASTSSAEAAAARPNGCSVAGFTRPMVWPVEPGRHWLPMNRSRSSFGGLVLRSGASAAPVDAAGPVW